MPTPPEGVIYDSRLESRDFRDAGGAWWRVRELPATRIGRFDVPPSLVFETVGRARRVYSYPGNWRSLDAAKLDELSNGR